MDAGPTAPFDLQILVELFAEAADVLHRAGPLDPKFEWTVTAARAATGAELAAYVEFQNGHDVLAVAGGTMGEARTTVKFSAARLLDQVKASNRPAHVPARPLVENSTSLIVVPVPSLTGKARGAIVLVLALGIPTDAAGWVTEGIAMHLGAALDNTATIARLAELEVARQGVVRRLQDAVRPPMLKLEGAELGVHYEPAETGSPIGGDLYDWHVLPDGDLHIAVVDISGHGVEATKDALAVTHALHLLVLEGCPLEDLIARADRVLREAHPNLVATLAIARYAPSTGLVRIVSGGHPPALLVTPDGMVDFIEARGIPIGYPSAGSAEVIERHLEHNQALVMYTDGVIEATRDVLRGFDDLKSAALEVAAYPARFLARALVERALAGANRRDDSLALVLRHRVLTAPARPVIGPFHYRFSPSTATVPLARHLLADWLDYQPVDPAFRDDLLFVATELCTNAVRAASGEPLSVELRASIEGDAVSIEVEDDGEGFVLSDRIQPPEPEAETGRGLFLVQALMDDVDVERRGLVTIIRSTKRAAVLRATSNGGTEEHPDAATPQTSAL